jgi:transcription antitermination factor NusG
MAEKIGSNNDATLSPADVHKGSGLAVREANYKWYIAECKPTKERTLRTLLQKADYQVYVASRSEMKVYKNRTRRLTESIMIPGKVFIRTEEKELMNIMLNFTSVWRFMIDRSTQNRRYAYVPDNEMEQLQYVLGKSEHPVLITSDSLKVNQKVQVMRGALAGLEGWFLKKGHTSYVVIKITMGTNHYVYTEIPVEDIQPL